jgi:hypothetical protein
MFVHVYVPWYHLVVHVYHGTQAHMLARIVLVWWRSALHADIAVELEPQL